MLRGVLLDCFWALGVQKHSSEHLSSTPGQDGVKGTVNGHLDHKPEPAPVCEQFPSHLKWLRCQSQLLSRFLSWTMSHHRHGRLSDILRDRPEKKVSATPNLHGLFGAFSAMFFDDTQVRFQDHPDGP